MTDHPDELLGRLSGFVCCGFEDGVELDGGLFHVDLLVMENEGLYRRFRIRIPGDRNRAVLVEIAARRAGPNIRVPPDPRFESWTIAGDDFSLICLPGGGIGYTDDTKGRITVRRDPTKGDDT